MQFWEFAVNFSSLGQVTQTLKVALEWLSGSLIYLTPSFSSAEELQSWLLFEP